MQFGFGLWFNLVQSPDVHTVNFVNLLQFHYYLCMESTDWPNFLNKIFSAALCYAYLMPGK
jgi:hypothetical protein